MSTSTTTDFSSPPSICITMHAYWYLLRTRVDPNTGEKSTWLGSLNITNIKVRLMLYILQHAKLPGQRETEVVALDMTGQILPQFFAGEQVPDVGSIIVVEDFIHDIENFKYTSYLSRSTSQQRYKLLLNHLKQAQHQFVTYCIEPGPTTLPNLDLQVNEVIAAMAPQSPVSVINLFKNFHQNIYKAFPFTLHQLLVSDQIFQISGKTNEEIILAGGSPTTTPSSPGEDGEFVPWKHYNILFNGLNFTSRILKTLSWTVKSPIKCTQCQPEANCTMFYSTDQTIPGSEGDTMFSTHHWNFDQSLLEAVPIGSTLEMFHRLDLEMDSAGNPYIVPVCTNIEILLPNTDFSLVKAHVFKALQGVRVINVMNQFVLDLTESGNDSMSDELSPNKKHKFTYNADILNSAAAEGYYKAALEQTQKEKAMMAAKIDLLQDQHTFQYQQVLTHMDMLTTNYETSVVQHAMLQRENELLLKKVQDLQNRLGDHTESNEKILEQTLPGTIGPIIGSHDYHLTPAFVNLLFEENNMLRKELMRNQNENKKEKIQNISHNFGLSSQDSRFSQHGENIAIDHNPLLSDSDE